MESEQDPELAACVVVNLHWVRAIEETRDMEGAELPDEGPGDFLLADEFLHLHGTVCEEMRFARKAGMYKMAIGDPIFNPLFNDPELYHFVGSLYLARHFADPVNRSVFLSSNQDFTEKQLVKLVERCSINDAKEKLSPKLADLTSKLLETKYITHQPAKHTLENEHLSPVLQRLRERTRILAAETDEEKKFHARVVVKHFRKLEKEIVQLYKLAQLGPRRHLSEFERCREEQAFSLPREEAARLLAAARMNGFFCDLISKMPEEAKSISHEQALFECAEHARLWLFNSRLQLYYNFSLTYDDIGKAPTSYEEARAWSSSVGFMAKLPSFEEKQARREALACHWDELENLPEERDDLLHKVPEYSMLRIREHDLPEKLQALNDYRMLQTQITGPAAEESPQQKPRRGSFVHVPAAEPSSTEKKTGFEAAQEPLVSGNKTSVYGRQFYMSPQNVDPAEERFPANKLPELSGEKVKKRQKNIASSPATYDLTHKKKRERSSPNDLSPSNKQRQRLVLSFSTAPTKEMPHIDKPWGEGSTGDDELSFALPGRTAANSAMKMYPGAVTCS